MDERPRSPQSNQVHQIVEKGAQIKSYLSDIVSEKILAMHGRPPAQFHSNYKSRDDSKHAVDLTEKSCSRILIACGMTMIMLVIGAALVGGILLAVTHLDAKEEMVTVAALNLNLKCPGDIVTRTEPGKQFAVVSWKKPVLQGNANTTEVVTFQSNHESNTSFEIGDHEVVYTVTDPEKSQETCSFNVKVRDKERPLFVSCPQNIKIVTDASDGDFQRPTWDLPKAADNAGPPKVTTNYRGSERFDIGTTVIRYTATDAAGNVARCVFEVTIIDGTPPSILNCPGDLTETTDRPQWTVPTAADNDQLVSLESDWVPGDTFPLGRTRVTYVAEDSVGLKTECSFTVTVRDGTPPTIRSCPSDITQPTDLRLATAQVVWNPPTAQDNGDLEAFRSSHLPGDIFPLGTTEVVYTAVDSAGFTTDCSFNVTIIDLEAPKFTLCPSNIEKSTKQDGSFDPPTWPVPMATDNAGVPQVTPTYKLGEFELEVKMPVQYTATDASGNTATCLFFVTVADETPPVISNCPEDITVTADSHSPTGRGNWTTPTATDNGLHVTLTSNVRPGHAFRIGRTRVTYTAVDSAGLTTNCRFTVTVLDSSPPTIHDCPSDITQPTDRGVATAQVVWNPPTAWDNGDLEAFGSNHQPDDIFPLGMTEVVYKAVDLAGLANECSFNVTVIDLESPKFTVCPSNIEKGTNPDGSFDPPTWPVPVATDNAAVPQVTPTYEFGEFELEVKTPIQYTATDASGNNATCRFFVTVVDETPPVIRNCPENITVTADPDSPTGRGNWTTPTATDNGVHVTLTSMARPGDLFHIGQIRVTYTAVDSAGLTTNCHFTVTVLDGSPPTIYDCPSDITQPTDRGMPTAHVFWNPPTAWDHGELVAFHANLLPGNIFPLGTTEVVYTAVDSAGFITDCSFNVTIRDLEAPRFTLCPPNIEKGTNPDGSFDPPTWPVPVATDNTGVPQVTPAHEFGEFELEVKKPIQYTATDAFGNNATCLFYVTVVDETPPVISNCPDDVTVVADPQSPTGWGNWTMPKATDNGMHVTMTSNVRSGDLFRIGRTRVTYTAVDNAGLTTNCRFTVTVLDKEAPVFTHCPTDILRTTDVTGRYAYPFWRTPQAVDNSGDPLETTTNYRFQKFELNVRTPIVYTATDPSGNNATCLFYVLITDGTPPKIQNCPEDLTLSTDLHASTRRVNWSLPTTSDNSKNVSLTSDLKNGDLFPLGSSVVTFTATDPAGLTAKCHFTVTVVDMEPPRFTSCPPDMEETSNGRGQFDQPVWETPHAVDNVGQAEVTTAFDFAPFELGTTTLVEYTATDTFNNMATCAFFVTISDGTRPVLGDCPPDVTVPTDPRQPTAHVDWTPPTAEDNSGHVLLTSNFGPGERFPLGQTKVIYTAEDAAGLRDRCRFTVTVEDTEAPVFSYCPRDIEKETNADGKFGYPTWSFPRAIDNSRVNPNITTTSIFGVFPLEEATPIEYVASDKAGNTASCRFYVTVKDRTRPKITDCPGDMTVSIDPRSATGRAMWSVPVASDNGRLVSFESNWDPGDDFPAGQSNVTYTAVDSVGLTSTCQFTVTVEARCNLSLSTPAMKNTYQYRFPFPIAHRADDSTLIRFDFAVRSAGTVFIALADSDTISNVYEIGLARSKSFIRCGVQCKPHYITVKVPKLLSGAKYQRFWITYNSGRGLIKVGRGGGEPFLEWQDPSSDPLDVQRIGIASYHVADWKGYLCKNGTSSKGTDWL
ncbi:hyalin-like [Acanthaster planci]|uniref:Hyalin-like n=1 Tax=Acanthaster planci TaxID=133434 RepID=A0A8B7YEA2_ACAPL|nr:hyalin-like [Acanthaster planci]